MKRYHRPDQKWICGLQSKGNPCALGPTADGKCQPGAQCFPNKVDGRWVCTKVGDACSDGPSNEGVCPHHCQGCKPIRSISSKMTMLFRACTILALGMIILMLQGEYSHRALLPGPISPHHSSFSKDCIKCHQTDLDQLSIFHSSEDSGSTKCLSCHKLGSFPNNPHGINFSSNQSVQSYNKANLKVVIASKLNSVFSNNKSLECIECHTEHKGSNHVSFENQSCQTCHAQKFSSFEKNHPEFLNYPYQRRTRIIFNHEKHAKRDFKSNNLSCISCHQVDKKGEGVETFGFNKSCSNCHLKEINGEGLAQSGWTFLQIPQVDLNTLNDGRQSWSKDSDGEIPIFVKVLLATDTEIKKQLDIISRLDLRDLSKASPEQVAATKNVLTELKAFYLELSNDGHLALKKRLEKIEGADIDSLISGFPLSLYRNSFTDWLPGSAKSQYPAKDSAAEKLFSEELMQSGGWYSDQFGMYYRPRGHADPFLKAWIELSLLIKDDFGLKEKILDPSSPGRCTSCHSVDSNNKINWLGYREIPRKSLNHFNHDSHFLVMNNQGCTTCHSYNPQADLNKSYLQSDPKMFDPGFLFIDKKLCADCHAKGKAGNSCLECHYYHTQ